MKLLLLFINVLISLLYLSTESKVANASHSSFGNVDSLPCPLPKLSDVFTLYGFLSVENQNLTSMREQLGLRTYSASDFPGDSIPMIGDVPSHFVQMFRDNGIEIVNNTQICDSIATTMNDVEFLTDRSNMVWILNVKVDNDYLVLYRIGPMIPASHMIGVKLDSLFNVIKVVEL